MAMLWEEIIAMMSDSLTGGKDTQQQISSEGAKMHASDPIKFVPKGWGYEKWIANSEKYCGKLLFIAKGKQCSWHYHSLKDEVFYIQSGKIMLYYGCLLYTSPSPRDRVLSRMPSSA